MAHGSERIGEVFNFGMLHLEWPTALFILVVFIVTMILLNALLFKPILRTLEARQTEMEASRKQTDGIKTAILNSESDYNAKLADVRLKIQSTRQSALEEAMEASKLIIGEARDKVVAKLEKAEQELTKERENALKEAASLTENLAKLIKSKVLA